MPPDSAFTYGLINNKADAGGCTNLDRREGIDRANWKEAIVSDDSNATAISRTSTRRRFIGLLAGLFGTFGLAGAAEYLFVRPPVSFQFSEPAADAFEQITPTGGIPTGIAFEASIQKLVAAGVIEPDKYRRSAVTLPAWVERLFAAPSDVPIVFSRETAPYLLDLLWAVGLANKAAFNAKSPIATVRIPSFASTGGWGLGRQQNGYVYFNSVEAVPLTDQQQTMVVEVASKTYRPCCNNSTFFQDCNHGSALLGLLELAASQGATLDRLYAIALTANSYWFPGNYAKTAQYFAHFHRRSWHDVDPRVILAGRFSSASGWTMNVDAPLRRAGVNLPGASGDQRGC